MMRAGARTARATHSRIADRWRGLTWRVVGSWRDRGTKKNRNAWGRGTERRTAHPGASRDSRGWDGQGTVHERECGPHETLGWVVDKVRHRAPPRKTARPGLVAHNPH